jgi:hypothetical protein
MAEIDVGGIKFKGGKIVLAVRCGAALSSGRTTRT